MHCTYMEASVTAGTCESGIKSNVFFFLYKLHLQAFILEYTSYFWSYSVELLF